MQTIPQVQEPGSVASPAPAASAGAGEGTGGGSWTGFLLMAFAVVGLVGALSTYAAQIPFQRALARNAALDEAASAPAPSPARLEALRATLGDSADRVLGGPPDTHDTVAIRAERERARMWRGFGEESADIGFRLRIVIAAFTAAAALFGVAVLSVVRRAERS